MNLQDILKDSKTFTDDMEITLGENKVKLGDIRNFTKQQQDDLTQRLADAKARQDSAADLASKAANLVAELEKAAKEPDGKQVNPDDFDTADWWNPVRTRLSAEQKARQDLENQLKSVMTVVQKAATIFAERNWEDEFRRNADRLRKVDKYKDWDLVKVRDYAVEHKKLDRWGMPSVEAAINDLTKESEMDRLIHEAEERGRKLGEQKSRMAAVTRPSAAARGSAPTGKSLDPTKNFNDLADVVAEDSDINKMLADLGALGPDDFVQ